MNKFPWSFFSLILYALSVSCAFAENKSNEQQAEEEFKLINRIIFETHKDQVASKIGAEIELREIWSNFGGAFRVDHVDKLYQQNHFVVTLTGEGAIDPNTRALRALFACHEIGHILGEGPTQSRELVKWSVVEGGADKFVGQCMWKYVNNEKSLVFIRNYQQEMIDKCHEKYDSEKNIVGCLRILSSVEALVTYFNKDTTLKQPVTLFGIDDTKVKKTLEKYPSKQCRIQTMISGVFGEKENPTCWYKA